MTIMDNRHSFEAGKRKKMIMSILTGLLLAAVLWGCGGETMDPKLQAVQGHWVDVNGSAMLDIENSEMRYTQGDWKETYAFVLNSEGYRPVLEPLPGENFGIMSELTVEEDGSLTAYEQILDAEGHMYRFVREEEKAALLEIRDFSEDLPRQIESKDISEFMLSFSKDYGTQYGLDETWPNGHYAWTMDRNADGTYQTELCISGDSYIIGQYSVTLQADDPLAGGLADVLARCGAVEHNGWHKANSVRAHDWHLWVKYASGERLSLRAEGDAAAEMPFDLAMLMDCAKQLGVSFE